MTKYRKQILFGVDKGFFKRVPNFIRNIIAFNRDAIDFYILTNFEVAEEDKKVFKDLLEYAPITINFHYVSNQRRLDVEGIDYSDDSRSDAMSIRLYANDLKLKGRLLYLDLDILCTANFDELFDDEKVDLEGCTLGVVSDSYINLTNSLNNGKTMMKKLPPMVNKLPFSAHKQYFNSGVLLIDCDKLAKTNIWEKELPKLDKTTSFPDQDLLNVIHFNDNKELGCQYNYLAFHLITNRYFFMTSDWFKKVPESSLSYKMVRPVFMHFAGKEKQWNNSASEWVDFYNLFNQEIEKVLLLSQEDYEAILDKLYQDYHYSYLLCDYQEEAYQELSLSQLKKIRKGKAWSYSPMLLNTRIFNTRDIRTFLKNAFASKGRTKLNLSLSSKK